MVFLFGIIGQLKLTFTLLNFLVGLCTSLRILGPESSNFFFDLLLGIYTLNLRGKDFLLDIPKAFSLRDSLFEWLDPSVLFVDRLEVLLV